MALIVRSLVVMALAISVGACAGKRVVSGYPSQSEPVAVSEKEPLPAKPIAPSADESLGDRLARQKAEREASEKEAEIDESERKILARAREIEQEKARAEIQKERQRDDTPEIRQARREAEKLRKHQEREAKVVAESLRDARLSGCDPTTVDILPLDQKFDPFAVFPSTLRIRILNAGSNPVSIDSSFRGYGTLVTNLCGGGGINLTFKLNSWEPTQQVPVTVWTKLPNGRVVSEMRYFFLQKSFDQQWIWNESWSVNLDNR